MNLITSLYIDKVEKRQLEYEHCIRMNVYNRFIHNIYVLVEVNDYDEIVKRLFSLRINLSTVKLIPVDKRPTYQMMFDISNKFSSTVDVNIISNTDIHFDDSLSNINTNTLRPNTCFALSRDDMRNREDSQDVWIFRGQINNNINNSDINLGIAGCDNVIAYELKESGYDVTNPSYSVNCIHVHKSEVRNYIVNDTVTSYSSPPYKYSYVYPYKF